MARKRPSLDAQLVKQAEPPAQMTPQPQAEPQTTASLSTRAKAREGKKAIAGFFEPQTAKQLKVLAANEERSVQGMLGEALNLLFEKYGLDVIASED